jgi:ABC-2 type transport system ATP-binding protein
MSILLGLRPADSGQARLFGSAPRRAAARGQVGAMLQDSELMAGVGVGELLRFIRTLYPAPLDLAADGTPDEVKTAAGAGRIVRFRLLEGDPGQTRPCSHRHRESRRYGIYNTQYTTGYDTQ